MPSDLSRIEVKEEGNLLIEAVSLLVQRQHESEGWIAEQIWQAEERAAAAERRYAELEARLAGIEEHLARLAEDVEPARGDAGVEDRLARLRAQVEGLKSAGDGRSPTVTHAEAPQPVAGALTPNSTPVALVPEPRHTIERPSDPAPRVATPARPTRVTATANGNSFWDLLGASPQDRFGVLLIGAGSVVILWAFLTQIRFG